MLLCIYNFTYIDGVINFNTLAGEQYTFESLPDKYRSAVCLLAAAADLYGRAFIASVGQRTTRGENSVYDLLQVEK